MSVNRIWFPNAPSSGITASDRSQIAIGYSGLFEVVEEVFGAAINIEFLRRKKEKERLKAILAEDEELIAMAASFMEVITKRWVH